MAVRIFEVGPRDGLQNEPTHVSIPVRLGLIRRLVKSGLKSIEIGSFVSAKWVPQMSGTAIVVKKILDHQKKKIFPAHAEFSVLVPNAKGMGYALDSGIGEVAVFTAASEQFSKRNTNCTIDEGLERIKEVTQIAIPKKVKVRGYISTSFYCPYQGKIAPKKVMEVSERLAKMGCYEISIGDTLGAATPHEVRALTKSLIAHFGADRIAMHFHDTRGTALANILASYDLGVRTFDSSVGGLGGCPYAPGALGNVATENVIYMFEGMGISTGVNLDELIKASRWLSRELGRTLPSNVAKAGLPKGFELTRKTS